MRSFGVAIVAVAAGLVAKNFLVEKEADHAVGVSSEGREFLLAFGSCVHHDRRPWRVFDTIAESQADVFIFMGDLIYPDWGNTSHGLDDLSQLKKGEYASLLNRLYTEAFEDSSLSNLMASDTTRSYFMWDDHELQDNYDMGTETEIYAVAREAFDKHVAFRNPPPLREGELFYTLKDEDHGFSAFVLDTRSHRSPLSMPDTMGSGKSMLGIVQLQELKNWMSSLSPETWKVIVSSVMWNDYGEEALEDGEPYLDGWARYEIERQNVFDYIKSENIDNVLLLSADAHWSGVFYFEEEELYEFSVSPLASPPLEPPLVRTGAVLFQQKGREGVFGRLAFAPAGVNVTFQLLATKQGENQEVAEELYRVQISSTVQTRS